MIFKNTIRQIRRSLGRYIAIFAIVALGVGFFSGLRVSKDAMIKTGENYFEELKLFDFRLISTLGLEEADIEAIQALSEVDSAVGSVSADMMYLRSDGSNGVLHMHTLLDNMNLPDLTKGRMPQAADECLIDGLFFSDGMLGQYIELSKDNSEDTFSMFAYDRYKVVGVMNSPYYANFERGSSSLGSVDGYAYLLPEGFSSEYYTECFVRMKTHYDLYSDKSDSYAKECEELLKPVLESRGQLRYETLLSDGRADLADAEQELSDGERELADAEKKAADAKKEAEEKLLLAEEEINKAAEELEEGNRMLLAAREQFEAGKKYLPAAMAAEQERALAEQERLLTEGIETLQQKREELLEARNELEEKSKEADEELESARQKLADARKEISDGYETLSELSAPTTYVLGRSTNVGYVSLENDTGIVSGIAKVFPLFFFLVAALVCVTTMTRMVDEQRVQNGTLKALGYKDGAIAGQYLFYAGSASLAGCIVGFLLGSKFMPLVLWEIYHIMYTIQRPIVYVLNFGLFAFCTVLFLGAALGATWFAVADDLREVAAELIRPKAPSAGKKVFLEKIGFLWKRMKFLHKVSIRNIFLYKKRMFMMLLGVGGCTALLLTGYGIRDSIQPIVDYQFHEIHVYDLVVAFLEEQDQTAQQEFAEKNRDNAEKLAFTHMESMELATNGSSDSVTLVAAENLDSDLVNLHRGKEHYSWPKKGEVIIDYRLAKDNNISIGDKIEFRDNEFRALKVKVVGIFDNYLRDYAYISSETYLEQMGQEPKMNTAYVNVADGKDAGEVATELLNMSSVASVDISEDHIKQIGNMLSSLDYVVLIVLVCAGALAFIVIYNLTNISINERIREIATIKVLGFYENESASYVFRENLILTVMSALVGLPMGMALHRYVMAQIRIKSMYFGHRILPMSFVWSVIITFVFAVIVDFFMYFRLKKINMAESLKSVD